MCEALAARTGAEKEDADWVEDDWEEGDALEEEDDDPPWESGRARSLGGATLRDLVALRAGGTVRRAACSLGDAAVRDLFALAWRCGLTGDAARAASVIVQAPDVVAPDRTLPAALDQLHREEGLAETAAYAALWGCAAECLLRRSETPPDEPRDWKIASDTGCECPHCAKLRAFCEDAAARVARFPLREELRRHLELVIRRYRLDVDHVTERKGRPYTLVCTKNRASYERRLTDYAEHISHMGSLIRSAPGGEQAARRGSDRERLREAVATAERS